MLEKMLKRKQFRNLVYIVTALIEVLGFALLFSPSKTIQFLSNNSWWVAIIIIVFGYISAVSVRLWRKK